MMELIKGQGKFSYVFKAIKVDENKPVALKLIKVGKAVTLDFRYGQRAAERELPERSATASSRKGYNFSP